MGFLAFHAFQPLVRRAPRMVFLLVPKIFDHPAETLRPETDNPVPRLPFEDPPVCDSMVEAHVDPDVFDLFLKSGVYREYAETYLDPAQIDEINIADYIGG